MLSYFEIENFFSFESGEESGLDLCGEKRTFPPTNVSIIFGNNASGKTNLIKAIGFFQNILSVSQRTVAASKHVFFAHKDNKEEKIHIKCEIIIEGNTFWYENTLHIKKDVFKSVAETLSVTPYNAKQDILLYESSDQEILHLSSYLVIAKLEEEKNHYVEQFLNYVKNIKMVSKYFEHYVNEVSSYIRQDIELKQSLISMLSQLDLHITNIHLYPSDLLDNKVHIQFYHQDLGKELPIKYESHGTVGLYVLLYFILITLRDNSLLIVDEIENAIHPDIIEVIIRIIQKKSLKKKSCYPQFIFTTHQIELMTLLGNKRAIFLAEKNSRGATHINNAEDFENIKSVKNAYKQYKLGRLGAIPLLSEEIEQLAIQLRENKI